MTRVPATLTTPRGSMGEQVDDLCCPPIEPVKTLADWHREFPHLTRTEGAYRPWSKSASEAA